MSTLQGNHFYHLDALEYAATWQIAAHSTEHEVNAAILALSNRIRLLELQGKPIPNYLFAVYRAYESNLVFRMNPTAFERPYLITLREGADHE